VYEGDEEKKAPEGGEKTALGEGRRETLARPARFDSP
jgi:hypothetical protein